jgi:hypothetical protein
MQQEMEDVVTMFEALDRSFAQSMRDEIEGNGDRGSDTMRNVVARALVLKRHAQALIREFHSGKPVPLLPPL